MTEQHPLDFDALTKGDTIQRSTIEDIYKPEKESEFRLACLRLAGRIESERRDLLVRHDGDCLRIMTDAEADQVLNTRVVRAVSSLKRQAQRRPRIDRSGFTDEMRRDADSRDRLAVGLAITTRKQLAKFERDHLLSKTAVAAQAIEHPKADA